jgi:hypothetical protein
MDSPASCWCVRTCDQIMDIDLTSDARRGSVEADDDDDDGEGGSSSANEEEEELMGAPPPEAQPVKVGRMLFWGGPSRQITGLKASEMCSIAQSQTLCMITSRLSHAASGVARDASNVLLC